MRLIVNSDDYGLTRGVNLAIIEALNHGILRSTTAMVNMPAIEHAAELSKLNPSLGVGLHLVLTAGKPIAAGHKTIVDENGDFLKGSVLMKKEDVDTEEVYTEYKAQMERFIQIFGRKPTHIDGHHHSHTLPTTRDAALRLAKDYGIEYVRHLTTDTVFIHDFYNDKVSVDDVISMLEANKEAKQVELMVHVAFIDVALMKISSYNLKRMEELQTLTCPKVLDYVQNNGIELTHF